jgi:hypothetical protein
MGKSAKRLITGTFNYGELLKRELRSKVLLMNRQQAKIALFGIINGDSLLKAIKKALTFTG